MNALLTSMAKLEKITGEGSPLFQSEISKKIWKHLDLWDVKHRPSPKANTLSKTLEYHIEYLDFLDFREYRFGRHVRGG